MSDFIIYRFRDMLTVRPMNVIALNFQRVAMDGRALLEVGELENLTYVFEKQNLTWRWGQ